MIAITQHMGQFIGPRENGLSQDFVHYRTRLLNPIVAPIFFAGACFTSRHDQNLSKYIRSRRSCHALHNPQQSCKYVCATTPSAQIRKSFQRQGYSLDPDSGFMLFWTEPLALTSLPKHKYEVALSKDPTAYSEHVTCVSQVFQMSAKEYRGYMESFKWRGTMRVVNIKNTKNETIATGSIITKDGLGYLFAGCVKAGYRRRGLWRYLTRIRQDVSILDGASTWILTTQNPILLKQAQNQVSIHQFNKTSESR